MILELRLAAGRQVPARRKLPGHTQPVSAGNVLILVLVVAAAALTVVATALSLASSRNLISMRSNTWNLALPVAEAGLEEALTHIQYGLGASNGWRLTNGFYVKSQSAPFGESDSFYVVTISPSNQPTITSAGYVRVPLRSTYLQRTLQITTTNTGRFPYGLLAKKTVTLGGNSLANSFNSSDPALSTVGRYDPAKVAANCKVGTLSGAPGVLQLGTTKVYGSIGTGPGLNTYDLANSATVGDLNYVNNSLNRGTAQPGHVLTNLNLSIPDVLPPFAFGRPVNSSSYTVGGTNYNYCLGANNYYVSGDFALGNHDAMAVTNVATLYVTGNFTVDGQAYLYLAPGAKLTLFVGTTNTTAANSIKIVGGGLLNDSGYAANFSLNALPSVTTASYSGNAAFVGTFYGPEADLSLAGGTDCTGALLAQSIKMTGGMDFHYDEALGGGQGLLKYIASSWREL